MGRSNLRSVGARWRTCAAFSAALLIAACSPAAAPTGTPPPSANATAAAAASSPTGTVFTSTRYKYSITLPKGWVATAATATWSGTTAPIFDDPVVDAFGLLGDVKAFGSAAPTTSSLADWVADGIKTNILLHGDECQQTPAPSEPITIGGQPGTFVAWNVASCLHLINMAFTVVNGTGYRFVFRDPATQAVTDPADKATFTTMLGSVVFH